MDALNQQPTTPWWSSRGGAVSHCRSIDGRDQDDAYNILVGPRNQADADLLSEE
jgi:hypothetical protein